MKDTEVGQSSINTCLGVTILNLQHECFAVSQLLQDLEIFQKNIYFCFIDYAKAFNCMGCKKLENS